jgi:HPt (histidine-containing phosphotransfer) domain-containing protein
MNDDHPAGTALVVESSMVAQMTATHALRRLGMSCDVAAGGAEALGAVSTGSYTAILIAMELAGELTAESTARAIRELPATDTTVIIGIADPADSEAAERSRRATMRGIVRTPLDPAEIAQLLGPTRHDDRADPEPVSTVPPLDDRKLREISDNDPEFVAELLELFREEGQRRLEELHDAAADNDTQAIMKAAHALKGAGGNIGATPLHELCTRLQEHARRHELAQSLDLVDPVTAELDRVLDAIRERQAADPEAEAR